MSVDRMKIFFSDMSLSARIICGLLAVIAILGLLQVWNLEQMGMRQKEEVRQQALQGRSALIEESNRIADFNLKLAKLLADMPEVKAQVGKRERQALLAAVKPLIDSVNSSSAIKIKVHFHIPPGVSFLRVWKPGKNGDDISSFRKTVVEVLDTGRPVKGIEAGRVGLAIRGVAPIFWHGSRPAGSVEVITSLAAVAGVLEKSRGEMNQIFAIPRVDATAAASKLETLGKFVMLSHPSGHIPENAITPALLEEAATRGSAELDMDNMLVTAVAIPDYQGKPTGIYVKFNDLSAVNAVIQKEVLKIGGIVAGVMLIAVILTFFGIKYNVRNPIQNILQVMDRVTQGQLDTSLKPEGAREIRLMARMGNNVVYSTGNLINVIKAQAEGLKRNTGELSGAVSIIGEGSKDIDTAAEQVATSSTHASETLSTVAASVNELNQATNEIAQSVAETAAATNDAQEKAVAANTAIERLGEHSEKIGGIVEVITSIAEQTNLLALNATIEAARAGEAGKGFAVVANEVKELAKQTAQATDEISSMISSLQSETTGAVGAVEDITEIVARVNDLANTIASAAEEQTATVAEINDSVNSSAEQVSQLEQQAEALAEQASEFSTISSIVEKVQQSVHDNADQAMEVASLYKVNNQAIGSAMPYTSSRVQMTGGVLAHFAWYEEVKAAIYMNQKPQVEHDPDKCLLGYWISNHINNCRENPALISEISEIHRELHQALHDIDRAVDKGSTREELEAIFDERIHSRFHKLMGLMGSAREIACRGRAYDA